MLKDTKQNPSQTRAEFEAKFLNLHNQISNQNTILLNSIGRGIIGLIHDVSMEEAFAPMLLSEVQKQLLTYKYLLERGETR